MKWLCIAVLIVWLASQPALALADDATLHSRPPLLQKVDDSIARGTKYLLSRQNPDGTFGDTSSTMDWRVGETSLITLALLSCGESHQSPQLAKAIKFLRIARPTGHWLTYAIGLRACVWATLPEAARANNLRIDLNWLINALLKKQRDDGLYNYGSPGEAGGQADFSNSQYGVLGVWYAANTGLEVPTNYWTRVEHAWQKYQRPDGGWPYRPGESPSYASMAAAGAATLFITNDYLHAADAKDLNVPALNAPLDRAMKWLGQNFAVGYNVGHDQAPADTDDNPLGGLLEGLGMAKEKPRDSGYFIHYLLFGYERVGEASGFTRFGTHRWFDEGADFLTSSQESNGSWTGMSDADIATAYSLLFLSRGRSAVAMQKLQFGGEQNTHWNNRPRDVANFVHFMRAASERHLNWQIVDADAPLADLRDAPILYIASDRPFTPTPAQREHLVTYVNEGGLLLFVNEGKSDAFTKSVIALCKDCWPSYGFRELPKDHPIIDGNFPMSGFAAPIEGLSNGVRELAVLIPSGDATWAWQGAAGATQVKISPYAPLANLYLYVSEKDEPRYKGDAPWIDRVEKKSTRQGAAPPPSSAIALLKFSGTWNPEPLAWTRLANILHNENAIELHANEIDLTRDELKIGYRIAHLTAASQFDLKPAERDALKNYLDQGGLLLFDAAGGSTEATVSFEALMADLYPDAVAAPLPGDHPIYTGNIPGGTPIASVNYRRADPNRLPPTHAPRLRGYTVNGKLIVIESPEDLTAALVGYSIGGITGYSPSSAVQLVRNMLLWRKTA